MSDMLERPAPKAITAADIRAALRRHFPAPECAIVFEVAHATGTQAHRHLDAVAMDLWPSRGLSLHGIEIKVGLYDWRREKANPAKAEQIARFCDYFWIAAPVGVVPVGELPAAWGMIVVDGAGKTTVAKRAEKTQAEPIGRPFLAAMMRAAARGINEDDVTAILAKRRLDLESQHNAHVMQEVERRKGRDNEDAESWRKLVTALGEAPDRFWNHDGLIQAVQVVMKTGVAGTWGGLRSIQQTLRADTTASPTPSVNCRSPSRPSFPTSRKSGVERSADKQVLRHFSKTGELGTDA